MRAWLLLLSLAACGPVAATVIPSDGIDLDTDGDVDGDTDPDTDVDTDPDTEPVPDPIYGEWIGERDIDFGRCDGTLTEVGELLDNRELREVCPDCELFYQLDVGPERICGAGVRSPTLRGLILGRRLTVVNIEVSDRGVFAEELAQGVYERTPDAIELEYEYSGQVGGGFDFVVEGQAVLLRTN